MGSCTQTAVASRTHEVFRCPSRLCRRRPGQSSPSCWVCWNLWSWNLWSCWLSLCPWRLCLPCCLRIHRRCPIHAAAVAAPAAVTYAQPIAAHVAPVHGLYHGYAGLYDASVASSRAYPLAEPYVHEDIAAEAYVDAQIAAEPYVHEEIAAEEYVHEDIPAEAYVHEEIAAEPYVDVQIPAEAYVHEDIPAE